MPLVLKCWLCRYPHFFSFILSTFFFMSILSGLSECSMNNVLNTLKSFCCSRFAPQLNLPYLSTAWVYFHYCHWLHSPATSLGKCLFRSNVLHSNTNSYTPIIFFIKIKEHFFSYKMLFYDCSNWESTLNILFYMSHCYSFVKLLGILCVCVIIANNFPSFIFNYFQHVHKSLSPFLWVSVTVFL